MDNRGQSSIEYMAAISFVLLAIASVGMYIYSDLETGNRMATASSTMQDIKKTADRVYASGPGRKETITIRVPTGVKKTEVRNGLIGMAVAIPNAGDTDNIEVVDADRVIGKIPSRDGIYQLPIEYKPSGVLVIGTGLLVEPAIIIYTTSPNATTFLINVTNIADKNITGIGMTAGGRNPGWFAFNDTGFSLDVLEVKTINVSVTIPAGEIPSIYTSYMQASTPEYFDENTVEIHVGGDICGDTNRTIGESCETDEMFVWPSLDDDECENTPEEGCHGDDYVIHVNPHGKCISCKCYNDTRIIPGACAGGVEPTLYVPIDDMENPNVTILGECPTNITQSTESIGGTYSSNINFTQEGSCRPTFVYHLNSTRPDGFYAPYQNGSLRFWIYTLRENNVSGSEPNYFIRFGNDESRYIETSISGSDLFNPVKQWNERTCYLKCEKEPCPNDSPCSPFETPAGQVDWNGKLVYFAIGKYSSSGSDINFLVDEVRLYYG